MILSPHPYNAPVVVIPNAVSGFVPLRDIAVQDAPAGPDTNTGLEILPPPVLPFPGAPPLVVLLF